MKFKRSPCRWSAPDKVYLGNGQLRTHQQMLNVLGEGVKERVCGDTGGGD